MDTSRRLLGVPRWSHEGSSRERAAPVVDPALIRALGVGQVAYIYRGGVTFIQVKRLLAAQAALASPPVTADEPLAGAESATRTPEPSAAPAGHLAADGARSRARDPASDAAALLDEAFGPEPG
jgi:hypothetical protein